MALVPGVIVIQSVLGWNCQEMAGVAKIKNSGKFCSAGRLSGLEFAEDTVESGTAALEAQGRTR
jgi:hypothetical protein